MNSTPISAAFPIVSDLQSGTRLVVDVEVAMGLAARVEKLECACRENLISARIIQVANKGRSYEITRDCKFIIERTEAALTP